MRNNKNGFTLVELLAVIVILAIILVIAVPKVMSVIKDSKKATLESTAKMIAGTAEKAKLQNQILGNNKEINCEDIVKINDVDYESCSIEFDGDTAKVTLVGSGKFEGLNVCNGTKTNSSGVNTSCNGICGANEEQKIYNVVKVAYEVNDIPSCVSYVSTKLNAVGATDLATGTEPICNGEKVDGLDFNSAITMVIDMGLFTEEELIENDVIKPKETEEVKVCVPKEPTNGVTYLSNMVKDENARKAFGLVKDDTVDENIRYTEYNPSNKVYYNCEDKDNNNIAYGEENYDYGSSCEVWRIIGVFSVKNANGVTGKRIKMVNTSSTFSASWDSSASTVNNGVGINQWGESTYSNGDPYEGADLMRLLNGYYIGKSGSTCRYCNDDNQETCEQVCDTKDNTLASQNMKPLTSIAKDQIEDTMWDAYAVGEHSSASEAYLQEKGISTQYTGNNDNDGVIRTTSWTGLVGLMSLSDIYYADKWLPSYSYSITVEHGSGQIWHCNNLIGLVSSYSEVYPSLYLKSNVQIIGGDGSSNTPYILK